MSRVATPAARRAAVEPVDGLAPPGAAASTAAPAPWRVAPGRKAAVARLRPGASRQPVPADDRRAGGRRSRRRPAPHRHRRSTRAAPAERLARSPRRPPRCAAMRHPTVAQRRSSSPDLTQLFRRRPSSRPGEPTASAELGELVDDGANAGTVASADPAHPSIHISVPRTRSAWATAWRGRRCRGRALRPSRPTHRASRVTFEL
jgi:hypothetical protein